MRMPRISCPGSAGCQSAVSGSLPEAIVFVVPKDVRRRAAAGCRSQQAGSLRSPKVLIFDKVGFDETPKPTRQTRALPRKRRASRW